MANFKKSSIAVIIAVVATGVVITALFLALRDRLPLRDAADQWLYDRIARAAYNFRKPPQAINDILLVLIDNDTLNNMPSRWPYPRSDFAKVIDNLMAAGAGAVAFDFTFLGTSEADEDAALKSAMERHNKVALACSVNDRGALDFCSFSKAGPGPETPFGIVTKLQDNDGVTRGALTYLVSGNDPNRGFLSWGMQILNIVDPITFESLSNGNEYVAFETASGKLWEIPVTPDTKSFLINFRAHTADFDRLSFYDALEGRFEPSMVKGRIAMVGLASSLFGDLHNTPIGWLPGITVNANAFLTLYARDFLKRLPAGIEIIVVIGGVLLALFFCLTFRARTAYVLITIQIALFFLLSYLLYINGHVWNYFDFPLMAAISSVAARFRPA